MHKQMVIHPCVLLFLVSLPSYNWAEARLKIARMTLTIKRDGNWSSFQLANSALPLSVTSSAIAPSARIVSRDLAQQLPFHVDVSVVLHLALPKKEERQSCLIKEEKKDHSLATARTQVAAREIVLWTTPSEPPKALQASECSELLDPMRASCLILAQHQPGKFGDHWASLSYLDIYIGHSSAPHARMVPSVHEAIRP